MSRVIQDSDDELEDESLEEAAAPSVPNDASMNVNELSQISPTEQPGTGSTESLKRAIEAAHRAHFHSGSQATPSRGLPTHDGHTFLDSRPQHNSKRRKTSMDISPKKSLVTTSQKKKQLKTYGRSKSVFSSPFTEQNQEPAQPLLEHNEGITDSVWNLQGTMRQYYEQHEPMAMFPDPSSTVMDGTMTQQRLMEEVMPPPFLGFQADEAMRLVPQEPEKSSIPWSEFLKSPNTDEHASGENSGHTVSDEDQNQSHPNDQMHTVGPLEKTSKLSQRSRRGSSARLKGSPLRNAMLPQDSHDSPLPKDLAGQEHPTHIPDEIELPTTLEPTPTAGTTNSLGRMEDRNQSSAPSQKKTHIGSGRREPKEALCESHKHQPSPVNTSDDLLENIGLPKEQYKPRPSRSRSLRVLDETPVDFSVAPEKAARKRLKRTKTIADPQDVAAPPTPQKVRQICDMGFTPTTTQRALKRNHGDVSQTVHWLVNNLSPDMEDELAPPRSSRIREQKKNSMKASLVSEDVVATHPTTSQVERPEGIASSGAIVETHGIGSETVKENAIDLSSPSKPILSPETTNHPKVIIPTPQSNEKFVHIEPDEVTETKASPTLELLDGTQSRKPKRRKTTFDRPEPTFEELRAELPKPEPVKEKKRGRGRPRKEQAPAKSAETVIEEVEDDTSSRKLAEGKDESDVLQEKDANVQPKAATTTEHDTTESAQEVLPGSTPPQKTILVSKEVAKTPQKQTKAGTPHSPLSKGKVTYRVGLSKRARIAPLLRIVKK